MKQYLVIGNPIDHSLSPKLHNYWIKKNNLYAATIPRGTVRISIKSTSKAKVESPPTKCFTVSINQLISSGSPGSEW